MLPITYLLYITISITITVWVGNVLRRAGRTFLIANFQGNADIADSVNHLLLVGFYLINFGFIFLTLKYGDKTETLAGMLEFLSTKIGLVVLVLGGMHFFNMAMLVKYRNVNFLQKMQGDKQ